MKKIIRGERGLTVEECLRLCEAPRRLPANASRYRIWKHKRDEVLIRLLYATFARISELIHVEIRDIDFGHHVIHIKHPKGRAVFKSVNGGKKYVETVYQQRYVTFDEETEYLIIQLLERRKKGPLITNSRNRKISIRQSERIVHHYAEAIGIQQVLGYTKNGRRIHLVTCKSLREAGERHCDVNGADRDTTARVAGHSVQTKERHYKKGNFEEDMRVIRDHHPLMKKKGRGADK